MTADSTFGEGDIRANLPRFEPDALAANLALLDLVQEVAVRRHATVGQVELGEEDLTALDRRPRA